jgi:predicted Zn finger-like uncharacterized protein
MSLVTKCAQCGTTFRVTSQQLQAQGGKVRCGNCMAVFDGLQALVTLPEAAPEPKPEQNVAAAGAATFELEAVEPAAVPQPAPVRPAEPAADAAEYGPAPEQLSLDDELFRKSAPRGARWWAAGAALLSFTLVGQAAHFYRSDLAVQYPVLKPWLVQMCDALRCKVSPPQRPRQIAIEASDLQVNDPARPNVIQLTATLRNHSGYDLGYPALDLVLTNTREHTLARRIFQPREYLDAGRDPISGIPANAEITVRLDLDTGDLNPAGFRLDLLSAPLP